MSDNDPNNSGRGATPSRGDAATSRDRQAEDRSDADLRELDDDRDREELRSRYYGLLQELRVVLPGVQVLLAFLLTVPFSDRFRSLDDRGRDLFAVALVGAAVSVVCLLTPTVLHRVAPRRARRARLLWGIRMARAGTATLGASTVAVVLCVTRLVYGGLLAWLLTGVVAVAIGGLWILLPHRIRST